MRYFEFTFYHTHKLKDHRVMGETERVTFTSRDPTEAMRLAREEGNRRYGKNGWRIDSHRELFQMSQL